MKLNILFKRNKHQVAFDDDLHSKFLHMNTGFGGGKTYALAMKMLKLMWLNRPHSGGIMAPSYPELKKDIIPIFEDIFEKNNLKYKFHGSDLYYRFPWSRGKLYLFSGQNALRGPNLAFMGINEAGLIKPIRYQEAIGRVRVKDAPFPQVASVGTPEGIASYIYTKFVEKPMTNSRIIYGDTRDNQMNLSEDYIRSMEDSYDRNMLDAYLRGLWVNMNGKPFYYAYSEKNEDRSIKEQEFETVYVGMDFNVVHMSATLWHFDGQKLKGFGEIVFGDNKRGADTHQMVQALRNRGLNPGRTKIFPDPAGNARKTSGFSDHKILRDAGYEVIASLQAPRMRQRQNNTNNLFDKGWVMINPDTMPKTRKDFQAVEQDPVTMGKMKDNPELTHTSDGFDYLTEILFPQSGTRPNSGNVKIR